MTQNKQSLTLNEIKKKYFPKAYEKEKISNMSVEEVSRYWAKTTIEKILNDFSGKTEKVRNTK